MFVKKIQDALTSKYFPIFTFCFAYVCFFLKQTYILAIVLALFFSLIVLFSKNANNIFPIILFAGFYLENMYDYHIDWTFYEVVAGYIVVILTVSVIFDILEKKKDYKLGALFYPLLVLDVAFLLGGLFSSEFSFSVSLFVLAFEVITMELYLTVVNKTENFAEYILYLLTCGGIFLTLQLFTYNIISSESLRGFFSTHDWFTAENINTTAVFMGLGIIGAFKIFEKKKYSFVSLYVALFLFLGIYVSGCRVMIILSFAVTVFLTVRYIIITKDKMIVALGLIGAFVLFFLFITLSSETPESFFNIALNKMQNGLSGREKLWPWCFNRFLDNPLFGIGFIYKEGIKVGNLSNDTFVMAHNTVLQFLCSTGLIGSIIACVFYLKKYKLVATNVKSNGYLVLCIIVIALSGMFDQSAITDFFVYTLSILLLALLDDCKIRRKK